jgi:hypothetical protein
VSRVVAALARLASLFLAALAGLAAAAALPPAKEPPADAPHGVFPLELEVELDPAARTLRASALLRPATNPFTFGLHPSLTMDAASVDGRPVRLETLAPEHGLRRWRIVLPQGAQLRLDYHGTLPALDRSLDHRGVLRRLPPMASPEGSFLPAGSGWYPQPSTQFGYRVGLSLPAGQRALVAGRLTSEALPADTSGRYRARYEFAHPADGIDLMAGPWQVRERILARSDGDPLRLRTWFPPALDAVPGLAEAYLDDSRRYLERHAAEVGPYPFTEFSVVAGPLPTGFGMPTLTYLGEAVLRLPFIRASSLGHEALHNWWGNGVFVDYRRGNWSEGLTTFMADHAYKEAESAAAAREMRLAWLRDFAALPASSERPLAEFRARTHGAEAAIGYGKAAMLFVMLRDLIGADAFARGIRDFWAAQRFRAASWQDLQRSFERSAGRSLAGFFEQWLTRTGGPAPAIRSALATPHAGRSRLTLQIEQPAPAYALHLPVEISWPGRSEQHWVEIDGGRTTVTLEFDEAPTGVELDPDLRLWRVLEPARLPPILRQWIVARAPRVVLAGGQGDTPAEDEMEEVEAAATALAARLFELEPQRERPAALGRPGGPLLLVGLHAAVDAALAAAGLPPRPADPGRRGSAQVWTVVADGAAPVAVVSARDTEALRALLRPLPHYGAQSWLVFEGGRATERGVWPLAGGLVPVRRATE